MGEVSPDDLESTAHLLKKAQAGDRKAEERLFARFYPRLMAIAHSRLACYPRTLSDTADVVQITMARAFSRLKHFENRGEGAFLAYLRTILINAVLEAVRRSAREGGHVARFDGASELTHPDPGETPSRVASMRETFERYEAALKRLSQAQREAVVMRIDFDYPYKEIGAALGKTPNAAHMFIARALKKMATFMREGGDETAAATPEGPR